MSKRLKIKATAKKPATQNHPTAQLQPMLMSSKNLMQAM